MHTSAPEDFTTGGQYNADSWFAESSLGPVLLTSQPVSRTNLAGTTATFWVSASGSAPLTCQWLHNGQPLTDGGNTSGAGTPSLVLSNVLGGDGRSIFGDREQRGRQCYEHRRQSPSYRAGDHLAARLRLH